MLERVKTASRAAGAAVAAAGCQIGTAGGSGRRITGFRDPRFLRFSESPDGRFRQELPGEDDEIVVSMSSGVDSSVTALMFAQRYRNVRGVFMSNWSPDRMADSSSTCTVDTDWLQVRATCRQLQIPCERVNFEREYWTQVFEPMLEQYERGYTPNPDIGCNRYVKFGKMVEHLARRFDGGGKRWWLVTGHYACILRDEDAGGEHRLLRAQYRQKDQSYYLARMPHDVLDCVLMPLGHYTKPEVRQIAREYDLVTKDKPDSQGLCFVSQAGKFSDFLGEYLRPNPGNIVTADGHVWGRHQGLWTATIGQRSGISMPQGDPRYKGVWLVADKNVARNELVIARKDDRTAFYRSSVAVEPASWYWQSARLGWDDVQQLLQTGANVNCQIRSLQTPNTVKSVNLDNDGVLRVQITEEIFGIAAGQTLALYHDDVLLGSGVICPDPPAP